MEPHTEEKKSRFRIEKLEERIAPEFTGGLQATTGVARSGDQATTEEEDRIPGL